MNINKLCLDRLNIACTREFDLPCLSFQVKNIFIGKSRVCEMTEFSGANDSSDFDGNTILLECGDNEYLYIPGLEVFKFKN